MTIQQLLYQNAVPVSSGRHAGCHVEAGTGYDFARHVNSLPLVAVEFPHAAAEYTIVFAGDEKAVMPAVILGLRAKENLFLDEAAAWKAQYVPAFARRYPFIFSSTEGSDTLTLCIDEAYSGFNRDGRGAALFGADGKPSEYTQNVLAFLQDYQAQFLRTQAFCGKLKDLGLLDPMQAQITTGGGEKLSLTGFLTVNRDRLKALSGEALSDLAKTDELELVYLHLHSMRNFQPLLERLDRVIKGATATA